MRTNLAIIATVAAVCAEAHMPMANLLEQQTVAQAASITPAAKAEISKMAQAAWREFKSERQVAHDKVMKAKTVAEAKSILAGLRKKGAGAKAVRAEISKMAQAAWNEFTTDRQVAHTKVMNAKTVAEAKAIVAGYRAKGAGAKAIRAEITKMAGAAYGEFKQRGYDLINKAKTVAEAKAIFKSLKTKGQSAADIKKAVEKMAVAAWREFGKFRQVAYDKVMTEAKTVAQAKAIIASLRTKGGAAAAVAAAAAKAKAKIAAAAKAIADKKAAAAKAIADKKAAVAKAAAAAKAMKAAAAKAIADKKIAVAKAAAAAKARRAAAAKAMAIKKAALAKAAAAAKALKAADAKATASKTAAIATAQAGLNAQKAKNAAIAESEAIAKVTRNADDKTVAAAAAVVRAAAAKAIAFHTAQVNKAVAALNTHKAKIAARVKKVAKVVKKVVKVAVAKPTAPVKATGKKFAVKVARKKLPTKTSVAARVAAKGQRCPVSEKESKWRMWRSRSRLAGGSKTCDEMQEGWKLCTVTTDPNHKYLMKNCPMTCAMYRGEACPVPYVPPPYVPAWSTRKEDTPFPGNCTRPKSIGQCGACLTGAQCKTGFCCPFLKLCVPNSKTGCHWKFMASCGVNKNGRGRCFDNIAPKDCNCKNKRFKAGMWQKPTCGVKAWDGLSNSKTPVGDAPLFHSTVPQSIVSKMAREVFLAQNKIRTDPKSMIPYVEEQLKNITRAMCGGKMSWVMYNQTPKMACLSEEGPAAWHEAIKVLNGDPKWIKSPKGKNWGAPVRALTFSEDLTLPIMGLVLKQGKTNQIGHTGPDGSIMKNRCSAWGKWNRLGENLQYGATRSGTDVIMMLWIDGGVPSRGHRDNIMDDSFTITGIFTGPNIKYGLETGLQYGDEFECNAACKAFKAKSRV